MIIVTGATGQFGSQAIHHLLQRLPGDQLGVSVRDVERAGDLAARGVRVRYGDFSDPGSLAAAFEGASQILVVSVGKLGEEGVTQATAAIDAAYRAGAERVVYTSHQAAAPESFFPPARDHAAVEAHLRASGQPYTSLRNGYYTASLAFHIGDAVQTGELAVPADGPVSWTARADLAQAAAAILAGDQRFEGPTPPLTASAAVDLAEVSRMLSELTGRTVRRVVVDEDDFVTRLTSRGMPGPFAQMFAGTYRAARVGEFAVTGPTLDALIGRQPQPVRAALQSTVAH